MNYTKFHIHDDTSNCNGFSDSCTSYNDYIKLAKKEGDTAIAFSNHGGIFDWIRKKQECDKAGIKYIHGIELYICTKFENNERGYHIGLYAKNFDGVKELNNLVSISTLKGEKEDNTDRHFYYNPRLSIDEIMNTSSNIIITTACILGILKGCKYSKNKDLMSKEEIELEYNNWVKNRDIFLKWMSKNKDRCFLEIQYHNFETQIEYNQRLYEWSKKYDIPLIAGTDTHSSTDYKAECRKILQKSKDSFYGEEDKFNLVWKNYKELVDCFKEQDSLPYDVFMEAIENTNKFANMVEDFKLDTSFKYPDIYGKNAIDIWKKTISKKFKHKKNNNIIDISKLDKYMERIKEEFVAMKKQGMESFMMFMSELIDYCNDNNIPYGFCRGSVGGSLIAYITDITDVDPIRWGTVFSRFCNADRISLADIDIDFAPEDREKVYNFIMDRFTRKKTAYISAFGTLKDRGTIDVLTKGLDYHDLDLVMQIKNEFDDMFEKYKKVVQEEVNLEELEEIDAKNIDFDYHDIYIHQIRNDNAINNLNNIKNDFEKLKSNNTDLFYYFDGLKNTIISKGNHPSGMVGSPITLPDNLGVFYKDGDKNLPTTTCAMKAVDSVNYVKFDILGLKTVGILKDAYNYINSHYLKSHEINWNDKNVWDNMIESNVGVFQFEGDFAFSLLKDLKPTHINDMSLCNAALRPSGKSYRDKLIYREFNINPSKEIDELLKDNYGYLVYQEDTIKFLTDICGFSGSLADSTRRCIHEDTLITMGNGNVKKIKDIKIGDNVISTNEYGLSESKPVTNIFNNGKKNTYKITTIHGGEIIATDNHKLYTQNGYKKVSELNLEDFIMSLVNINSDSNNLRSNQRLSCKEMFLIGMLIGDGTIYKNSKKHTHINKRPSFTNSDMELINKFKDCILSRIRVCGDKIKKCEFTLNKCDGKNVDKIYNIRIKSDITNESLINLLDKFDLRHHSRNKKIHNDLMNYPIGEKLQNLLGGLFSTDGGGCNNYIDYSTISKILAYQIKNLLLKFGIYSYVDKRFIEDYNYYSYRVYISQTNSIINFKNYILEFVCGEKQKKYNEIIDSVVKNNKKFNYMLPNKCRNEIRNNIKKYNKSINSVGMKIGYKTNNFSICSEELLITDVKAKEIIKEMYAPYTYWLLNTEYIPLQIKSIEEYGVVNVYDIEVSKNHNYIANNLVSHNCIGKKDIKGLKEQLPKILDGYCNTSSKPKEIAEEEAKQFLQIINDSSEYQFGYNHSTGYSMNGYACTRLRTYYPLEFTTAYLNRADKEKHMLYGTQLAKNLNIKINKIKFGKSTSGYTFDKNENAIYKGMLSIKYLNSQIAEELYNLSKEKKYNNFLELLIDIKQKTSLDDRQLKILTTLKFFREFGKNKKLLKIIDLFNNLYGRKQLNDKNILEFKLDKEIVIKYTNKRTTKLYKELNINKILEYYINKIENENLSIVEQMISEIEYLGYINTISEKVPKNIFFVKEFKTYKDKAKPYLIIYRINNGEEIKTKITKGNDFISQPFKLYSIIKVKFREQFKTKMIAGKWVKTNEKEKIIDEWEVYK
jgi:DNA polymerase III alpha subunit/intein/homing endonuclease